MAAAKPKIYDALIVGSGASGGWEAKELTEAGMEVLMLGAGPPRFPARDFTEHTWPYQVRYRLWRPAQATHGTALFELAHRAKICLRCQTVSSCRQ